MIIKRTVFFVLLAAFVALGAGAVWKGVSARNEFRAIAAEVAEENGIWDDIQRERRELQSSITNEKDRLSELPDSLSEMKGAQAVKSSLSMAKMEGILRNKEHRVKKRLEYLEERHRQVKSELTSDLIKLGVVEVVLLAGLIVAYRRTKKSRRLAI